MRFDHFSTRSVLLAAAAAVLLCVLPVPASAQSGGAGLRAGVSADPDQFYFGAHLDTGRIVGDLSFRPNVEVGVGNDLTTVAGNFEFVYWIPLRRSAAAIYAGGGPAINVYRWGDNGRGDSHTDTQPGFNLLVGVAHRRGLFGEFKLGLLDSPEVKFGVGYTWR
jgi:hypothetical protein